MSATVTRLRVDDEAFLVASMIERCPKLMMLRELVQNALEAAALAPPGTRRVSIGGIDIDGVPKLLIRNTGPGMGPDELFRMCDLSASIGKEKALDGNFGMGAKVAALTSNRLGMRYRSCRDGRVNEVTIGKRDGIYGRIRRPDPLGGAMADVLDVTGSAISEGRPLQYEWTELVLLGNRRGQDTVADPFDGDPALPPGWIADGLYNRFHRFPEGVEVVLQPVAHSLAGPQPFRPIMQRLDSFERHEAVRLPDGIVVHYLLDPPDPALGGRNHSEAGALQSGASTAAVVYRGEMYDVRRGWEWSQIGAKFGVSFGVQHVCVHVELPDSHPVLPDAYRQFLRYTAGDQGNVEVTDFAQVAAANRPEWLIDRLRAMGPDIQIATSIRDELQMLMRGLRVRKLNRAPQPAAGLAEPAAALLAPPPHLPAASSVSAPLVNVPAAIADVMEGELLSDLEAAPEIVLLRDERHVHDRLLNGRAASYDGTSHELFVNLRYPAFDAMVQALASRTGGEPAQNPSIQAAAEQTMVRRLGRALVYGLAKREAAPAWDRWQLQNAVSPETLTVIADDFMWVLPEAERLVEPSGPVGHA